MINGFVDLQPGSGVEGSVAHTFTTAGCRAFIGWMGSLRREKKRATVKAICRPRVHGSISDSQTLGDFTG